MQLTNSLLFVTLIHFITATEVLRPRGVPLHKVSFYHPSKEFKCIDGSATHPITYINDDYCDCTDGSDEPGTAACSNGHFHCRNIGYKELDIVSGRVKDGICDCCDGSDEYNSTAHCVDNCMQLGEEWRAELKRQEEQRKEGFVLREQYVADAAVRRIESEEKLEKLKKELQELEPFKNEKDAIRKAAEEKERIATDEFKRKVEEAKKVLSEEDIAKAQKEDLAMAESAFLDLDINDDEILSYKELQSNLMFDQNKDGVVSDEEAKFFLHMKDEMDLSEFTTTGWVIMKPYYVKHKESDTATQAPKPDWEEPLPPPEELTTEIPEHEHEEEEEESSDESQVEREEEAEMNEDDDDLPPPPSRFGRRRQKKPKKEEAKPVEEKFDEETQRIIDLAKKVKEEFAEIESKYNEIQNQIRDLESFLSLDFGAESEFMVLHGQCFDFHERQYVYKFCPFDRASQKEDTGSEVNLGKWGKWNGSEANKYEVMRLDGGAGCWNGPSRSVDVHFKCGVTNELLSASEPNRCEYRFDFQTPAMCVKADPALSTHEHTEL